MDSQGQATGFCGQDGPACPPWAEDVWSLAWAPWPCGHLVTVVRLCSPPQVVDVAKLMKAYISMIVKKRYSTSRSVSSQGSSRWRRAWVHANSAPAHATPLLGPAGSRVCSPNCGRPGLSRSPSSEGSVSGDLSPCPFQRSVIQLYHLNPVSKALLLLDDTCLKKRGNETHAATKAAGSALTPWSRHEPPVTVLLKGDGCSPLLFRKACWAWGGGGASIQQFCTNLWAWFPLGGKVREWGGGQRESERGWSILGGELLAAFLRDAY